MSKNPLRKDKTCLNCNYVVEKRFSPNCGQENTDTRKTFHHLFVHFFEDLTHYENAFWKTIKNLILKPASLTKEYLLGKRLSYLAPVRLYIFISFVTFFIMTVFNANKDGLANLNQTITVQDIDKNDTKTVIRISTKPIKSTPFLKAKKKEKKISNTEQNKDFLNFGYNNIKELDSLQKYSLADKKLSEFEYELVKKTLEIKAKYNQKEILEKFAEGIWHNFPKVLFLYMPLFAFVLWLFHGKKRWFYYDHGIFTIHYFSFLLLTSLLIFFFNKIMNCFVDNLFTSFIHGFGKSIAYIWMLYYFFPAHYRFYGESKAISFVKSITMFCINIVLMVALFSIFIIYTFINLH